MRSDRVCGGCGHGGQCHSVYYRLGHTEGPSVVSKVLVAFGVPIVVFIVTLALADIGLGGGTVNQTGAALLSFVLALTLTTLVVLGIWRLTQRPANQDSADDGRPRS